MTQKTIEEAIIAQLDSDASLRLRWERSPEASHIPFNGNREHFFLLVSLYLKQKPIDREKLLIECIAVALLVIKSGLLTDEKAVEISAYVEANARLCRVIRLTVLDVAFNQILKVDTADLLRNKHEGIIFQWPLQPPRNT